jgi:hypothetical protein
MNALLFTCILHVTCYVTLMIGYSNLNHFQFKLFRKMVRYKNRALLIKVVCLDNGHCGAHLSPPILYEALAKACHTIHGAKSAAISANMRVK